MNADREQFGMDRLCDLLQQSALQPIEEIVDQISAAIDNWAAERVDDITLVAVRYDGPPAQPAAQ
jgi:serine phosphatase RsbU (regulator of sigma subunit)